MNAMMQLEQPLRPVRRTGVVTTEAADEVDDGTVVMGSPFGVIANFRPLPAAPFGASSPTPRRRGRQPVLFGFVAVPNGAHSAASRLRFGPHDAPSVLQRIETSGCFDVGAFDIRSSTRAAELMCPLDTDDSDTPHIERSVGFFGLRSGATGDDTLDSIDDHDEVIDLTEDGVELFEFEYSIV